MRKMSNMKWLVLALLVVTMTAAAQQSASVAPQNQQAAATTQPAQAQTNLAPPTTMDQVVDRVIMREKELISSCHRALHCRDLPAKPDPGHTTGAGSAGRSLLSGTHGPERVD